MPHTTGGSYQSRPGHRNPKVSSAFREVFHNVPRTVRKTGKKGLAKRKMLVAIALAKARKAGASIQKSGDVVRRVIARRAKT